MSACWVSGLHLWALHSRENSSAPCLLVFDGSWPVFSLSHLVLSSQAGPPGVWVPAHQDLCSDPGCTPRHVGGKAASVYRALLACFPSPLPRSRRKEPILGRLSVPCPCHAACSACSACMSCPSGDTLEGNPSGGPKA